MSEFDVFDSEPPSQNAEEDPAAAFLAREQTELAGLEDDNFTQDNEGDFYHQNSEIEQACNRCPPTSTNSITMNFTFFGDIVWSKS